MSTLRELIDKHRDQVPGLKVRRDHWEKFGWLEILDIRNGNAIGWNNYGGSTVQALDSATENWELYRPPGPSVRPPAPAMVENCWVERDELKSKLTAAQDKLRKADALAEAVRKLNQAFDLGLDEVRQARHEQRAALAAYLGGES